MNKKRYLAFILLGSNLNNRSNFLKEAIVDIEEKCGSVFLQSSVYETQAWGVDNQPNYLNQVIAIYTLQSPQKLLEALLLIERKLGRIRTGFMNARTIDLDVLFFDDEIIKSESLEIPHPRLHLRKFVLTPLNEIAPNLIHPIYKQSINDLLINCLDSLDVKKFYE